MDEETSQPPSLLSAVRGSVQDQIELEVSRSSHLRETYVRRDELKGLATSYLDDRYLTKQEWNESKDAWYKLTWSVLGWLVGAGFAIANIVLLALNLM